MFRYFVILLIISLAAFYACDSGLSGELNENQPPTTSLTVNEINLDDDDPRLVSQVNISWWGDDPDGYVVGFEFFIGEGYETAPDDEWVYTTDTDSTFILPIEEGDQDADVRFTVRAVDNEDARDPNPPSLVFPITNSPPQVQFRQFETPPDTTFRIASFGFQASDPDGDANLNRIEIALNDTTSEDAWKDIGLDFNLVTFRVDDTSSNPTAEVFLGRSVVQSGIVFEDVNVNGDNEFFIRAVDNAAAISNVLSYEWYIKQQQSRILLLNDFQVDTESRLAFHDSLLALAGINNYDLIDISDGVASGGQRVPLSSAFPDRTLASPTTNLMLAEWDYIYWISNNLLRNVGYALEMTLDFFDNGGKMFINIPSRFLSSQDPLLQFLPIESVEAVPSGEQSFFIGNGSELQPSGQISNPPQLTIRRNRTSEHPIVPLGETIELFEAPFQVRGGFPPTEKDFDGSHLISAANPEESLLYFGIDFTEFATPENSDCVSEIVEEGDILCSDLDRLMELLVIDILGFQE